MRPEPRGQEGSGSSFSRWKAGLETPLEGRFWRETRLLFAPPVWYDVLTWGCIAFGSLVFLSMVVWELDVVFRFIPGQVRIWMGPAVFLAGLWGQLSSERMTVDLKSRTFARREGQGVFKRSLRGSVGEIDAVVAMTEVYPFAAGFSKVVIYRLVIHWKNNRLPLLVVAREQANVGMNQPLNLGAAELVAKGARFAQVMGVPFYDNTYFESAAPLRPV